MARRCSGIVPSLLMGGFGMGSTEGEHSILDALEPSRPPDEGISKKERSILAEINHLREHIETLEEAARIARAVEFDQIRAVVEQLEAVAVAAKAVERDLTQELATTNRLSVSTARLIRDQLADTLRALAEALVVQNKAESNRSDPPSP
jgi:uncharacterized protein YjgD (DUF1641 family)